MSQRWSLVIPVKGDADAKSRLRVDHELRGALALAFAMDTVAAAVAVRSVAEVIVVAPAALDELFRKLGARRVDEAPIDLPGESRLNSAVREGLRRVRDPKTGTAVLLGDLPRLHSSELADALSRASTTRSFVPDAAGSGTALITARAGFRHLPRFGSMSAAGHRAAGYLPIPVSLRSGLRRDVDTIADLGSDDDRAFGPATRAALQQH